MKHSDIVFVPISEPDEIIDLELVCDYCYTSERAARQHWWFKQKPETTRMEEWPLGRWVEKMLANNPCNPFESLHKWEVVNKYPNIRTGATQ